MPSCSILTLPGWQNSGPQHWQSRWEALYGYQRVEQHDWRRPLRGDWTARLQEVVVDSPAPVVLVAHSLGCVLAAWWAAHSPHAHRVRAALLVAPGDIDREDLHLPLHGWAPLARQPLAFPALLVASRNDPFCRFERAQQMAQDWGARCVDAGAAGHLNADSGLGDWPQGQVWLQSLIKDLKD
ncbi:MAG: alpha/beta hydrolase [Burkholderiaceae bacterium]|jgi:predicted alpha/beta hydrolase family esterase|nr:alpha/beta hydrolase [Burkholderiaceae bacterium]